MTDSFESDADGRLVELARAGSDGAFAELWRRHSAAGLRYARSITREVDSDDIVSEAFARIFSLIKQGKGPTNGFRSYLAATIRHTSQNLGSSRREVPIDFLDELADDRGGEDHQLSLDRALTMSAFRTLPKRWQEALWYSEVEGLSVKDCAQLFGIKPTAMAMLTFRAREGLREAWIQAHISESPEGSEHQWTIARLGAYSRNNLPRVQRDRVEAHLRQCERCSTVAEEARFVGSRLAVALLAPIIGLGAATYFLSGAAGGDAAAAAELAPRTHTAHRDSLRPRAVRVRSGRHLAPTITGVAAGVVVLGVAVAAIAMLPRATHPVADPHASTLVSAPPATPSASPAPTPESTLSAVADTGHGHVFYPELSGRARPNASIHVSQGGTVIASIVAGSDGHWSTGQLVTRVVGALTVASGEAGADERVEVPLTVLAPDLGATTDARGVQVSVAGVPGTPFVVTSGGRYIAAAELDDGGRWVATYPVGSVDPSTLAVRYRAGDRFGPATTL